MTKRKIKKHITKRKNAIKATKKWVRLRMTRKSKYGNKCGGEPSEEYKQKNLFRRTLNNFIIQIKNKKNIKQAINSIIKTFEKNKLINTLIPVTIEGKPVDKETYSLAKNPVAIYDFVSPITVIFDNLTGIISDEDIIRILNAYFLNGGNFNNLSSRSKITPFENEVNKGHVANVKILHHSSALKKGYRPMIHCGPIKQVAELSFLNDEMKSMKTGDNELVRFTFVKHPELIEENMVLFFRDGSTKGVGEVVSTLTT